MKIVKYTKLKKNKYNILFDDDSAYDFYDDVILKHGLLLKKELTKEELELLKKENNEFDAFYVAVDYLNKKLRTKAEIIKYLNKKEYSTKDIDKTIKILEERNLINDTFVATCYMNDQINFNLKGPYKIKEELEHLGVSKDIIDSVIDYHDERYQENIKKIINKKVKTNHNYGKRMLINKIKNDLYNMGYRDIDNIDISYDDHDLLKKEYDKLLKKYQNHPNKDYIIKQKLYQKGYSIDNLDI